MRARFIPLLLVPLTGLEAQGGKSIARTSGSPARRPMAGACAAINVPSELMRTPEGLALLRFKKEIEGAKVFVQRDSAMRLEQRRLVEMQRGVDSLMQAFVRVRTADSALAPSHSYSYSLRKGDSTVVVTSGKVVEGRPWMAMEGAIKAMRPDVEVTLRSLEPRMNAMGNARMLSTASTTGYMGINLSGSQIRMVTDSGVFTAHCDYPMIEAVDVGSPARKADLRAGDTIVAYNNRDIVSFTINYPQLLVPGKVVKVRVKRDGKPRDVAVTVAERPQELVDNVVRYAPTQGVMIAPSPASGGMTWVSPGSAPTMAPMPRLVAGNVSMMTVLGAQLNAVDEEFAQRSGLEPGIMVLRVIAGTPAAEAGLRPGELIQAVNGVPTRELVLLQRAINVSGARDVKLTVTAKDTPARIVTIRW